MTVQRTYVTIVSGMPRSGTSLMMSMLHAGGIPALTDGTRPPDPYNPHGYFEDQRSRRLAEDASWLEDARGKAVKVIYRLLPHLPPHLDYRVVFMERDLDELFDSQQAMLQARHDPAAGQDRDRMIRALDEDLDRARRWLARQVRLRWLSVPYAELVHAPGLWVSAVSQFLDRGLDEAAMAARIDPALYRHRKAP